MRLKCNAIKAKDIEVDTFIYVPNEKRFFWVDDIDIDDEKATVMLIFEINITKEDGLIESTITVGMNDYLYVVDMGQFK